MVEILKTSDVVNELIAAGDEVMSIVRKDGVRIILVDPITTNEEVYE